LLGVFRLQQLLAGFTKKGGNIVSNTKEYILESAEKQARLLYSGDDNDGLADDIDASKRNIFVMGAEFAVKELDRQAIEEATTRYGKKDFSFCIALLLLKQGSRVCRSGWNGKGMWLVLSEPNESPKSGYSSYINGSSDPTPTLPFIVMKTATNELVPWLASQTDMLSEDWMVLE